MFAKEVENIARRAKRASIDAAHLHSFQKNRLLAQMGLVLKRAKKKILQANQKDLKLAKTKSLSNAFLDRLLLNENRLQEMINGLQAITKLLDPIGKIVKKWKAPSGVGVAKVRIPLGVIAVIYESRPNVTVDAAALTLKSGNAIILRGGSEAFHTNRALAKVLRAVLEKNKINPDIIQFFPIVDHQALPFLLQQDAFIDLVIPRGGEDLMELIRKYATIPIIRHDKGVCHIFVDRDADLKMAQKICLNAKVQRPSTCNAMETLLVDKKIAQKFLPTMLKKFKECGVKILNSKETDWSKEHLDLIVSLKIVKDMNEAIVHIQKYGSLHTESIITQNKKRAKEFLRRVLASCVMVNASTRLNDGFQLGLGAEIGISTTKLHAFGPMGLEELTTTKFVVAGHGQIRK